MCIYVHLILVGRKRLSLWLGTVLIRQDDVLDKEITEAHKGHPLKFTIAILGA